MKGLRPILAIGGIVLAGLGGIMAIANPGPESYEEYATEQLTAYLKNNVCPEASQVVDFLEDYCRTLVETGRPQIRQLIAQRTERRNYLFFSIYETNLTAPPLASYHFETVGILQRFHILEAEEL